MPPELSADERALVDIELGMPRAQSVAELTRSWSSDVIYFDFGVGAHGSKESAIKELSRQFRAVREIATRVLDLTVITCGELAASHSLQNYRSASSGALGTSTPQLDFVFRKSNIYCRRGGGWLLVHQHVSVPVDVVSGRVVLRPPTA